MSSANLRDVKTGRTDWKVRVRVIRDWKGVSITGQVFKGWNLLLLDAKNCRMQAYVPATLSDRMARIIQTGKIYLIYNFEVKEYLDKDKFRAVQIDRQIVFTVDTKVKEIPDSEIYIPQNTFDFYDFGDLKAMAKQTQNLIDVVGIVEKTDKLCVKQSQQGKTFIKFKLTNGRIHINVTFWNSLANELESARGDISAEPIILIIASGRVTSWHDEIDICNYSPTKFFLNYDHHSVMQLRKEFNGPNFSKGKSIVKKKTYTHCTIEVINTLGPEFSEDEVICKATINYIDECQKWKILVCTSCYQEVHEEKNVYSCTKCRRVVPYPNKKFQVHASISDPTGRIEIVLLDREVRTLLGKNVINVEKPDGSFPTNIKTIQAHDYTLKILIKAENVNLKNNLYEVNGIYLGWNIKQEILQDEEPLPLNTTTTAEASGSSYHLDDISQIKSNM